MMHQSQAVVSSIVLTAGAVSPSGTALNARDVTRLTAALKSDSESYWYSGLVSLGESISGVMLKRHTWSIVKAYYATFYLSRAFLASKGVAVCYQGKTPWRWNAVVGACPEKLSGNTHDCTLRLFEKCGFFPRFSGQFIGVENAIDWLIEQRNLANYKIPRFPDPALPECMRKYANNDFRSKFDAYVSDDTGLYYCDSDHAILAFPLEMAKSFFLQCKPKLKQSEYSHLMQLFRDSAGPFARNCNLFQRPDK